MCFSLRKKSKKNKKGVRDEIVPVLLSTQSVIDKLNNVDYRLEQKLAALIMMERALNAQTQHIRDEVHKLQDMQAQFREALRLKQD